MRLNDSIPRSLKSRSQVEQSKSVINRFEKLKEKAIELEKRSVPDENEVEAFRKEVRSLEEFTVSVIEDEKQLKLKNLAEDSAERKNQ